MLSYFACCPCLLTRLSQGVSHRCSLATTQTGDKAKALDKFSFPLQLDFTDVLAAAAAADEGPEGQPRAEAKPAGGGADGSAAGEAAEKPGAEGAAGGAEGKAEGKGKGGEIEPPTYPTGSPVYELVAILIHKGGQAHSGHYGACRATRTFLGVGSCPASTLRTLRVSSRPFRALQVACVLRTCSWRACTPLLPLVMRRCRCSRSKRVLASRKLFANLFWLMYLCRICLAVAHIKDQRSGQWWRFDDETAECMGDQPTGFPGDHGAAAAAAAAAPEGAKGGGGAWVLPARRRTPHQGRYLVCT